VNFEYGNLVRKSGGPGGSVYFVKDFRNGFLWLQKARKDGKPNRACAGFSCWAEGWESITRRGR